MRKARRGFSEFLTNAGGNMRGIELSKRLFEDIVYPVLEARFRHWLPSISAAIVGDGSEVLGFDDEISQDHNYCPRVVVFIEDEEFGNVGQGIRQEIVTSAPREYYGFELLYNKYRKFVDVVPLTKFFLDYLNTDHLPKSNIDWLKLEEQRLLELTAGEVFYDPQNKLEFTRRSIWFFPNQVRYFLLYKAFARLSEVAAIERSIRREDYISTEFYRAFFLYFAVKALHLYKRRYCPYRKWMGRNLLLLGEQGKALHDKIRLLVSATDLAEISRMVTDILVFLSSLVTDELDSAKPRVSGSRHIHLLDFDWDAVMDPLRARIPADLDQLSNLIAPISFWGLLFDITGYGGNYEAVLRENLELVRNG